MNEEFRSLDEFIDEIIVDAYNEYEQTWAFVTHLEEEFVAPTLAEVVGEAVEVTSVEYDDERRGPVVRCRRKGREFSVSLADIVFLPDSGPAWTVAAYRRWLGLNPWTS
jgi:hypothetical protein